MKTYFQAVKAGHHDIELLRGNSPTFSLSFASTRRRFARNARATVNFGYLTHFRSNVGTLPTGLHEQWHNQAHASYIDFRGPVRDRWMASKTKPAKDKRR